MMRDRQKREKIAPGAFALAHDYLRILKSCDKYLTRQEMLTLRGQALHGELEEATRGLDTLMKRRMA